MNTTTNADRVRKANAKLIALGGRRMPSGYLQPEVNAALEALIDSGYAGSPVAAISQALIDAHKKITKKCK